MHIKHVRHGVQIFFLAWVSYITYMHQVDSMNYASVDAICPFGGLETLYKLAAGEGYLKRVMPSSVILFSATVLITLLFSRIFCSFICALGSLQEFFGMLGKKILKKRYNLPEKIDVPLRYLKYVVLAGTLLWTWSAATLVIRPYDPFAAFAHIWSGTELFEEFLVGAIILVLSLLTSMFSDRTFCKYLCPFGAFLALIHKLSPFRIKRDAATCINCKKCNKDCPVNIPVAAVEKVNSAECLACFECVETCPTKKNTLQPTLVNKKFSPLAVGVAGIGLYVGVMGGAAAAGIYKTREGSLTELAQHQKLSVEDIRGKYSLKEVAQAFELNITDLYAKLGITVEQVPPETKIKEVGKILGEEEEYTDKVRTAVSELLQKDFYNSSSQQEASSAEASQKEKDSASTLNPDSIKGSMTLKDVSEQYGINVEEFYTELNLPKDKVSETMQLKEIKTILQNEGRTFEVQEIRDFVKQKLQNK